MLTKPGRPYYTKALAALQAAHDACFKHPDRDVLGMSHGPFSGVNEALGVVSDLEDDNISLRAEIGRLRNMIDNRNEFIARRGLWRELSQYLNEPHPIVDERPTSPASPTPP